MTLAEALTLFLSVDRAPATTATYRKDLGRLVTAIGPQRALRHVTTAELTDYFAALRARRTLYGDHPRRPAVKRPLSDATLTRVLKSVRAFFNWSVRQGFLATSPASEVTLRRYKRPPGSDKAITPQDLAAMVEFARRKRCHATRDYALLLFLADTGCRVSGCASLRLSALDLVQGTALLQEKGRKPARVYFGDLTAAALRGWLSIRPRVPHDYVWVNQYAAPLAAGGIAVVFRRIAIEACGKSLGPHVVRHRVGQAWADAGVNPALIALKLNHSDVGITLANYVNQDQSRLRQASRHLSLIALQPAPATSDPPGATRHPDGIIPFPVHLVAR